MSRSSTGSGLSVPALATFIALNVLVAAWRIILAVSGAQHARGPPQLVYGAAAGRTYDYHGDDYPQTLLVRPSPPVALSLSSTLRYAMQNDSLSDAEWASVLFYAHEGRVQLGSEQRAFIPVYFHQYHCVRALQRSLLFPHAHNDVNVLKEPDEHVQHCLNYLRQTFLCNPLDQLEPGDFLDKSLEPGTVGSDLVCVDWEKIFEQMDSMGEDFLAWNEQWN